MDLQRGHAEEPPRERGDPGPDRTTPLRRVGLVAAGEEATAADSWLAAQPLAARRYARPAEVPLGETDCLWLHGALEVVPELEAWLRAGGRLLATGEAVRLPAALGLEAVAPEADAGVVPAGAAGEGLGFAGLGSHPLFAGLGQGAIVWHPAPGEPSRHFYYRSNRLAAGAAVAVWRSGLALDPDRVVAWEYRVGRGGVLCLGAFTRLAGRRSAAGARLERLLVNALAGDGIPHETRQPAPVWPPIGRIASKAADELEPSAAELAGEWVPSGSPLVEELAPGQEWTLAGRRVVAVGGAGTGLREVWAHPLRTLRVVEPPGAGDPARVRVAPDEVVRRTGPPGRGLVERWTTALEPPVLVWDLWAEDGGPVSLAWETDLQRAWPYPAGSHGDLRFATDSDGRILRVRAAAGPEALFTVVGGRLSAEGSTVGPVVRVTCAGAGHMRLVALAGVDSEDLGRTLRGLQGRGLRELQSTRARHAAQLLGYGTGLEPSGSAPALRFERAKVRADALLAAVPGVGRSLLLGPTRWCFGSTACRTAAAQLAAGGREAAREVIRFLAETQDVDGGIVREHPVGGLAGYGGAEPAVEFLGLVERYAAWTGDLEYLRRHWGRIRAAGEAFARAGGSVPVQVRERLGWIGEALGDPLHPLPAAGDALPAGGGAPPPASGAAEELRQVIEGIWGVEPDAPAGAVALRPTAPADRARIGLRRLRVGRSVLHLDLRRRGEEVRLRVHRAFGPAIVLTLVLRGAAADALLVDDVELRAGRARFEATDRHEVVWHLSAERG